MHIGTITFHAAHNFGSVLQAYALQTFVEEICEEKKIPCEYTILNYRSPIQKQMYRVLPCPDSLKNIIKLLMRLPYYSQYKEKYNSFETFISKVLHTSTEVNSVKELLLEANKCEKLLCGSDQIWNIRAKDSTIAYYLYYPEKPKYSYAASFGPLQIDWNKYDRQFYSEALKRFKTISVREEGSADIVEELTGKRPEIHVDPTLLLDKDKWESLASNYGEGRGKYILVYCLEPTKNQLQIINSISQQMHLPVIITRYNNKNDYFNNFIKCYSSGPDDFLSLVKNAELIITSSFHGTAFSILMEKTFFVIDGLSDNRISSLLSLTGLTSRSINSMNIENIIGNAYSIDFCIARKQLIHERQRSKDYLLRIIHEI